MPLPPDDLPVASIWSPNSERCFTHCGKGISFWNGTEAIDRYSLIVILLGLVLVAGVSLSLIGEPDHAVSSGRRIISGAFFFGIPILLSALTLMRINGRSWRP